MNFKYLFNEKSVGEALVEELAGTIFARDLDGYRNSKLWKTHRNCKVSSIWQRVVRQIVGPENHRNTVSKYSTKCYLIFKRKYKKVEIHYEKKRAG